MLFCTPFKRKNIAECIDIYFVNIWLYDFSNNFSNLAFKTGWQSSRY